MGKDSVALATKLNADRHPIKWAYVMLSGRSLSSSLRFHFP